MSRTGIFHVLFALFFSTLTIFIFQDLVLPAAPRSFQPILPIHFVHRKQENTCIESHNVADITFTLQQATRFEANQNTSSIVGGLSPRQDHRRRHSLQDWRIRPIAHQGADQGIRLIISHCQSHSTLQLPTCYERLLALSNPCWTLPVGCSLVHRGQIESTINCQIYRRSHHLSHLFFQQWLRHK